MTLMAERPESPPDLDEVLHLLAHPYRRRTVARLSEASGPVSFDELVRDVVEVGASADDATPEDARLAFHHVHLPKLEEHDVVSYDEDARLVEPAASFAAAYRAFSTVEEAYDGE
jgi:DNA-binding transcriptional ArsR family regulator